MKLREKQTGEKITVIDIDLTRGLVVAFFCVLLGGSLLAYLALTGESAAAAEMATSGETSLAASTGKRWFYVTNSEVNGKQALTACAPGYHMASLWEIADPTNLKYNTELGKKQKDSGQGPPAEVYGWVRTGFNAHSESVKPGWDNCDAWSTEENYGTKVGLNPLWIDAGIMAEDVDVWTAQWGDCSVEARVWCVKD